jgi:hypothetical protein
MVSRPCSTVILARPFVSASVDLHTSYAAQLVALRLEFNGPFRAFARSRVIRSHRRGLRFLMISV